MASVLTGSHCIFFISSHPNLSITQKTSTKKKNQFDLCEVPFCHSKIFRMLYFCGRNILPADHVIYIILWLCLIILFVCPRSVAKLETLRFAFTTNVNGKNYHVIMIFLPFFTSAVCRLPFSTREEDCFRVRQQPEYLS